MNDFIEKVIQTHLPNTTVLSSQTISGGCINSAVKVITDKKPYFLKWNRAELSEMFHAEKKGLVLLNEHSTIKSPCVLGIGELDKRSYLLLEWLEKGTPKPAFWDEFGTKLALQHKQESSHFGLDHDNYIGSLPQSNKQHTHWYSFFIEERLIPQIKLASSNNLINREIQSKFESLFQKLENLIPNEKSALLHGDLWSGNFMVAESGDAIIFDPAAHYGHRETELAFTKLFGGFEKQFYTSYHEHMPLEPGFDDRVDIHNLYPLLVHVNLFGSSYLSGIIQTLNRFT
jgi:fructosamine-3-kinase